MRQLALFSLFSFVGVARCAPQGKRASSPPTAKVRNGTLEGYYVPEYGEDFFLGIPYAQAPVGALRLANPLPLEQSWKGIKDAKEYYPSCVGYGSDDWGYPLSEDCLALNVVRPAGVKAGDNLPVAVWIHGGGYYEGGSRDRRYNESFIVENSIEMGKPIVAASLNYRLAQWGFLYGSPVQEAGTANLGIKDQRLALHWIQENIAAFGGDPTKVTIWGESAGGGSVGYQSMMYGGRDDHLFRGIIAESYGGNNDMNNLTAYNKWYANVTAKAGCPSGAGSIECLREVPFDKLNLAFNTTFFGTPGIGPVIDGDLFTEYTSIALGSGKFTRTPILIGCNSDEGTAFGQVGINTTAEFSTAIASVGPDSIAVDEILKLYPDIPALGIPATLVDRPEGPLAFLGQQWKRQAAFFGDWQMHALRRWFSQQWTRYGVKSYAYRFNVRPNGMPDYIGVTHFQEVAFVFDNIHNYGYGEPISALPFEDRGPKYYAMAKLMDRIWISFVHDQDPNGHGIPDVADWPEYASARHGKYFLFDVNVTSHSEDDTYRQDGIAFINANAASQFHR